MNLNKLKELLQQEFTKTHTSQDYVEALSDGLYSCQFDTSTALEQWIDIWSNPKYKDYELSRNGYSDGVRFVKNQWEIILSKDKGEEL